MASLRHPGERPGRRNSGVFIVVPFSLGCPAAIIDVISTLQRGSLRTSGGSHEFVLTALCVLVSLGFVLSAAETPRQPQAPVNYQPPSKRQSL